jgi:hypothetical protein
MPGIIRQENEINIARVGVLAPRRGLLGSSHDIQRYCEGAVRVFIAGLLVGTLDQIVGVGVVEGVECYGQCAVEVPVILWLGFRSRGIWKKVRVCPQDHIRPNTAVVRII